MKYDYYQSDIDNEEEDDKYFFLGWRNVIRIAAINCYSDDNSVICDEHNVRAYPTLRVKS